MALDYHLSGLRGGILIPLLRPKNTSELTANSTGANLLYELQTKLMAFCGAKATLGQTFQFGQSAPYQHYVMEKKSVTPSCHLF